MSWLSKGLKKIERGISNAIPHVHSEEKRAQMERTKSEIDYYNTAKQELEKSRADAEEQKNMERKRISEKQIRSRQRIYRREGFMSEPAANTPADKLG